MSLHRSIDGAEPLRAEPLVAPAGAEEQRRALRAGRLGGGTLACPTCDAPVTLATGRAAPADVVGCGFCGHAAPLRDFLSLAGPPRPTRVEVRVVERARA